MSEPNDQAAALNAKMRELGVLDPAETATSAGAGDGGYDSLPPLELPRDGWGLDDFAREAGKVTKLNGVFRRDRMAVTINKETGQVEPIDSDEFRTYLANLAFLFKWKSTPVPQGHPPAAPRMVKVTMSKDTAGGTLKSPQFLGQQRKLARVNSVRQPIMRADGRIELLPEGYDAESGVFTMQSDVVIREDMAIEEAREILRDLHREFPFADWASLPVEERRESRELAKQIATMVAFYAALLLPHTINRLGTLYNANTHRSGKTLLVQIVVITVQGRCKLRSKPESPEEFRKVLETTALAASPYLVLDDLTGRLANQDLNSFMTAAWWSGRLMNSQREFEVPIHTNVFLTGHNLDTSGDIAGRMLEVLLHVEDADVQQHAVRRVINEHWLSKPEVRADLCSALYALVRHWDAQKRPEGKTVKPGFESWCRMFGGIVETAGFGDPLERRQTDETTDPEFEDMKALVAHLFDKVTERVVEVKYEELIAICQEQSLFEWIIEGKWQKNGDERTFEPSGRCHSRLGLLWSRKYGGRVFHIEDGRSVRFGARGRQRHKRYQLTVEG